MSNPKEGIDFFIGKKIVFIELDYHAEVVDGFCEYVSIYNLDVTFILSREVVAKTVLKDLKDANVFVTTHGSFAGLIKDKSETFSDCDLILLNTIDYSPHLFVKLGDYLAKTTVRIHNANTTFAPLAHFNIPNSLFLLWKETSYFFRKIVLHNVIGNSAELIHKCQYILPPNDYVSYYIKRNFPLYTPKLLPFLEFYPFQKNIPVDFYSLKNIEPIKIVIPGKVDARRRDFNFVCNLLKRTRINRKIEIVFLGTSATATGKKVKKKCLNLDSESIKTVFFEGFVSKNDFTKYMNECDIVFCPIERKTVHGITQEYYGSTKVSGNYYDALRHNKLLIGPSSVFEESERIKTYKKNDFDFINKLFDQL